MSSFLRIFGLLALISWYVGFSCLKAAEDSGPEPFVIGPRPETPPLPRLAEAQSDVQSLRSKLSSDNPQEITIAVEALVKSGAPGASAALWELYNRGNARERMQAVGAIGQLRGPLREKSDAEYLLRVAVGDIFQRVRFAAAESLAKLESRDKAVARLKAFVFDPNPKFILLLKMRALYAVAHIGGPSALATLKECLDPKLGELAMAAAESIGMFNDPAGVEVLVEALGKADDELKPAIADALETLTQAPLRYDLIKWQQWLTDRKEKEKKAEPFTGVKPRAGASPSDAKAAEGAEPYAFPVPNPPLYPAVDLVVVFDTTGSMLNIWPQVSAVLDALIGELTKQSKSLRIATIKYRASRPQDMSKYLIEPKAFSRDIPKMRDDILDASFGGGSGGLHLGVRHALSMLTWRSQSIQLVLVVGDTTPRDEGALQCLNLIKDASETDRVLISTLFVKNTHGDEHRETYKRLALAGSGRFYEYNKAEKHLVDMLAEKIEVKKVELPAETAKKLLAPRE